MYESNNEVRLKGRVIKGKIASFFNDTATTEIYTQTVVAEDIALINRSSDQGVSATVRVVNESDLGEAEN